MKKVAMVTGASNGIGKATALQLADAGFDLVLGARNRDRLSEVATAAQAKGAAVWIEVLDVRSLDSATHFVEAAKNHFGHIDILVNNAGLAIGTTKIAEQTDETEWETMIDTNVMGLLRMTRLVVPLMIEHGYGHVVNLGSTAGHDAYAGGSVYCATKFSERAISTALRHELLGHPIRVTSVDPGMVETDFSVTRFHGDQHKADQVYQGMTPLTAEDIADIIVFAVTRKAHVDLDTIIVRPTDQAGNGLVHRR
ncbi:MAG: SDR family NAD(P)-dependent oxidoreductase [Acidibacillus sp.]|uniref:Oxidoreductase n=1 Tax=Sulfoacidibacillus ferrooxidans TaxID=2005001 RepID=A0A9X1VAT4_9BACL|nr:SDR family NAD(P)-dependent oxidoreductase [Sulfoacidibacillus ferrooxidans]MCI0183890.1 putative oxidoreductase [Sulfoacidibacillus ferrooxidans]MCY0893562.1 SDR family NAD(P)-dependent oxidoreductase [Acidibacillus sp.]